MLISSFPLPLLLVLSQVMATHEDNQVVLAPKSTPPTAHMDKSNAPQEQRDIVLSTSASTTSSVSSTTASASKLRITDTLICDDDKCYPRVFKPSKDWQIILPEQQLPGGLDIRLNLETGLKEAKLLDENDKYYKPKSSLSSNITSSSFNVSGTKSTANELVPRDNVELTSTLASSTSSSTPIPSPTPLVEIDTTSPYEFSSDFNEIRELLSKEKPSLSSSSQDTIETIFDNVMEFAHDYKHGFKIMTHEFDLLKNITFNDRLSPNLRELSARMMTSCLRNNPPVSDFVVSYHPTFIDETFTQIDKLIKENNYKMDMKSKQFLLKRYITILDELIESVHSFTKERMETLQSIYLGIQDRQIKVKVLELISKCFMASKKTNNSLFSRDDVDAKIPNVQDWVNEFAQVIQDKEIDEWHIRKFFDSLYNIKKSYKKEIKIDSDFLNWLANQVEIRQKRLNNNLKPRDVDQDAFDEKLIESRHLIFGNPLAHGIKS